MAPADGDLVYIKQLLKKEMLDKFADFYPARKPVVLIAYNISSVVYKTN